jgi:hypothetical protein
VVLASEQVAAVPEHVQGAEGVFRLMAQLRYGRGGVASPLDPLDGWQREDVDAAVAATRVGWVDSIQMV